MKLNKEILGWLAIVILVTAVAGAVLDLSGRHLGDVTGAILILALASTFFMCWMTDEIPAGWRFRMAVISACCWVALVAYSHVGHGIWHRVSFVLAVVVPLVLALLADFLYEEAHNQPAYREASI